MGSLSSYPPFHRKGPDSFFDIDLEPTEPNEPWPPCTNIFTFIGAVIFSLVLLLFYIVLSWSIVEAILTTVHAILKPILAFWVAWRTRPGTAVSWSWGSLNVTLIMGRVGEV
ncbi:hypothetical protein BDW74DRAFT_173435 [Aspergillus multicolor]|uniref:uncharacterized protein n=1 Tax=Aspergillus multicolor TaxID=41759 RepID=UPI003CCDFFF0